MANIKTLVESKRGCGYRKPGGTYLIGGVASLPCGKLPIPLDVCPCCGAGIKFSRGFQWISSKIIEEAQCSKAISSHADDCFGCKFGDEAYKIEEYGLMWVGESFYKTPAKFLTEASIAGISKRINSVPRKLVVGKTWILLAHIHAIANFDEATNKYTFQKGIFSAFRPTEIQYIVTGKETEEELNEKEARGITCVKVVRDTEAQKSFDDVLFKFEFMYKRGRKIISDYLSAKDRRQARRKITKYCKNMNVKLLKDSIRKVLKP